MQHLEPPDSRKQDTIPLAHHITSTGPAFRPAMNTPPNVKLSARKTHRKTRTGCRTCKQRKIKCDEQRPSCHNCIKHSVQCDFLVSQSIGPGNLSNANTPPNHLSPHTGPNSIYGHDQAMSGGDDAPSPGLNLLDLELLHNYITATSFTLHTDPAMKILWKINVPQVGFQYDFVMRGVLAISALHMARFKPERRDFYIAHAMQQHQLGLRMATSAMQDLTKENCTGVWLFSALTLFFTLGSPRGPNDFLLVGESGLSDWLFLVKGTSWIIDANEDQLKSGHLGPMFLAGKRRAVLRHEMLTAAPVTDNPLDELQGRLKECGADAKNIQVYVEAVDALRVSFVFIFNAGPVGYEISDIFYWVFSLGDDFLQLLKLQSQESMSILSFFCVVLRRLDAQWWLEGWSTHLMSKIWSLLDEEHRLWIRWPIEEIGWIPPFAAY